MASAGTSLDDLDNLPDPNGNDVDALINEINGGGNGGGNSGQQVPQERPYDTGHASQPSINVNDIMNDVQNSSDRQVIQQPRKKQQQYSRQPQQQHQQSQEYVKVPPSALRKQSLKDQLFNFLHLPIIIAIAIVIIFTNPFNEMLGTWIPSAAGAIYSGALTPTALYIRAAIVGIVVAIYKRVIVTSFPSVGI